MKNLDKPLSFVEFKDCGSLDFSKHHGLDEVLQWEYIDIITGMSSQFNNVLEDYEIYLIWCKIAQSPLYKALA